MTLGGFDKAGRLLEFDQVLAQVASYCRTALGREKVAALEPSEDLLEVATRQQETTETRRYIDGGGSLEFGPENDISELIHRAMLGGLLRGEELYAVRAFARAARYDRDELSHKGDLPLLSSLASNIPELGHLDSEIGAAISPAGEVLDYASPLLGRLRAESRQAQNRLNEIMERNLRRFQRSEVVQEPLITQRNGRMVLLIKTEMRYRVPGIVHDVSDSGATVFVEPMAAVDMGNRWREARLAEEREVERVLRHLTNRVGDTGEDLLLALDIVARLDLDVAKARYSAALRATPPVIGDDGGRPHPALTPTLSQGERELAGGEGAGGGEQEASRRLRLSRARHPLLLSQSKDGDVVPISLSLDSERGVLLVTGPNAGGKTVALKTVGLLAMMAHAGLHIPAEEARFPGFDGIYADIGDQQSIQESLSTFSSHITNLLDIMRRATGRSLVLVDELGTSTDPEEGAALASAVLRHFQRMGVFLVGTTHQRGVARTVQEHPGMLNASVDLDPMTLAPTYQLTVGLPGRSYALTIAARLGLPQEIIEDASAGVSPVEQATETLLRELQQERRTVEELKEEAESSRLAAARLQQQLEEQLSSVEATKTELVEEARRELQLRTADIVDRLQRAERSMELAASAASSDAPRIRVPSAGRESREDLRESQRDLREVQRELDAADWQPIEIKQTPWQERLKSGDRVYVRGISQPVEVITPPEPARHSRASRHSREGGNPGQARRVEVLLGTMRAKIPVYQLQSLAEGHPAAARQGVYLDRAASRPPVPRRPDPEMDLRGLRVDEAVARVDTALNDAALDGASLLRIIHGKGTGALRRAIREYLADHPLVQMAGEGEGPGGEGVTVAQLR